MKRRKGLSNTGAGSYRKTHDSNVDVFDTE